MSAQANHPSAKTSNDRLAALEQQFSPKGRKGGWKAIAGKAGGDHLFREAMELGKQWRDQANSSEA